MNIDEMQAGREMIQEGDTARHKPTGEEWYLLGVNKERNRVCVAGWPPTMADLSDCELVKKGSGISKTELEYRREQYGYNWDYYEGVPL